MMSYAFCVPLLPGGEDIMKQWMKDEQCDNPNHDRVFAAAGITRERVWVQRTPMGDFAVACWDTENPAKTMEVIGTSSDPWAVRFRQVLTKVHGIDFTKPMPLNEQVLDWGVKVMA